MLNKRVTYSVSALKALQKDVCASVYCIENCQRCFTVLPHHLNNIKDVLKQHLRSTVASFDRELNGIILGHTNTKIVSSLQLSDDGDYKMDYLSDIFIFRPAIGDTLSGRVNKKSQDHLGVLVHSVFNATLPRPRVESGCPRAWAGSKVKIGEQVKFEVSEVNFLSKPPQIKGMLTSLEETFEDGADSGIGGNDSNEEGHSTINVSKKRKKRFEVYSSGESSACLLKKSEDDLLYQTKSSNDNSVRSSSGEDEANGRSSEIKGILKNPGTPESPGNLSSFKKRHRQTTLLELQKSLFKKSSKAAEDFESNDTDVKEDKDMTQSVIDKLMNLEAGSLKGKKRKKSSILPENNAPEGSFPDEVPRKKRRKISLGTDEMKQEDTNENTSLVESTMNNLINSEISGLVLKEKKKKSKTSEEIIPNKKKTISDFSGSLNHDSKFDSGKHLEIESHQESAIESLLNLEMDSIKIKKDKKRKKRQSDRNSIGRVLESESLVTPKEENAELKMEVEDKSFSKKKKKSTDKANESYSSLTEQHPKDQSGSIIPEEEPGLEGLSETSQRLLQLAMDDLSTSLKHKKEKKKKKERHSFL